MSAATVCVVGSLNEDTSLRVSALPLPGETVLASGRTLAPGGKGANQAAAAAVLGGQVAMVGAVGADEPGARSLAALAERGVDISAVQRYDEAASGIAIVVVDESGENHIVVDPGANAMLAPTDVGAAVRELEPGLVLVQLEVPIPSVASACKAGRAVGATVVLNPAPMPEDPSGVLEFLGDVDVLVPNCAELGRLARRDIEPKTLTEVAACVEELDFSGVVVVTMGSHGAYVTGPDVESRHVSAEAVDTVDTSGAGDVFSGCLAVRLAAGAALSDAVAAANHAAAVSTTVHGAQVPVGFTV
ncbi:MAG: ribokinase [Nocardioides sp.]|uniref:ribokinase n=1 Tax=Nocardioides sp. TaxID=35761 RepID=UPI0039E49E0D